MKQINVRTIDRSDLKNWDAFVMNNSQASPYHLSGWKSVVEKTYGHRTFYLLAETVQGIAGILPLVHLRHPFFGNTLISLPFVDVCGLLANNQEIAKGLIDAASRVMDSTAADEIEFRQQTSQVDELFTEVSTREQYAVRSVSQGRVGMTLDLPDCSEQMMQSFRAKLRNQIRRPLSEGFTAEVGGAEYLDDFYRVFSINMRDLGSPVHSKRFFRNILETFENATRVFVVYREGQPAAASIVLKFNKTMFNPWASSQRKYSRFSPNMLLYWTMLEYACNDGLTRFDFGRSMENCGTFRFKKQWGATPSPLFWTAVSNSTSRSEHSTANDDKERFSKAIQLWKKIPVPISQFIGPVIRKNIGL